jgi:hypothetical protein
MGVRGLGIVRNTCYSWRRRGHEAPTDSFDEEQHSSAQLPSDPETLLLQSDDATLIARALSSLPNHFHQLLILRELEGLSYRELSEVIGICDLLRARVSDCPGEQILLWPGSGRDQVDAMADFDAPGASDGCVQTEVSAESANDIAENPRILLGRVWIVSCHDATPAEIRKRDLRFGQPQDRTRPLSLRETFNAADHQIRTQASDVVAERRHRTVGTHEQWEDIEPFWGIESLESGARLNRRLNPPADLTRVPGQPVHPRLSIEA